MAIKLFSKNIDLAVKDRAILTLYGRWLAMNYTTSDLNNQKGIWWLETLNHFVFNILPNYKKNGSLDIIIEDIEHYDNGEIINTCMYCNTVIDNDRTMCLNCEIAHLPF